ncbi:SRPBCC family protein [Cupriavidus respiraculi]|uniref:Activator of Hsp90 ATPase homologue 1/2-like C-terminal domain-containing protein n=1 Tax=Cupriavidus respiraculi TaxID=195930 RepID=A0ABM8WDT6_9BURK|nr:SRPBCC family protein [Cupriavidus respiraculi]CAG9165438.1 hypothetical protein LMG21510_00089 [Cupriavidus respiraculi]
MTDQHNLPAAHVEQAFPVSSERLFDAWLDPAMLGRWMFGPAVREERIVHLNRDAWVGGRFSFLVERGGERIEHVGEYLRLDRPMALTFTWAIGGEPGDSRVNVTIEAAPDGCALALTHTLPAGAEGQVEQVEAAWYKMLGVLDQALREPA